MIEATMPSEQQMFCLKGLVLARQMQGVKVLML
jgi:hypothetical protein